MAKQSEPYFDFDVTRFMGQMPVPGIDMDAIVGYQKRNIDALAAANRLAFEGMQAIFRRQAEIMRQNMEEVSDAAGRVTQARAPQESLARQAEIAKEVFERNVANMKELAEMTANSNMEVMELINRRIAESLDEVRDALQKAPILGDATIRTAVATPARSNGSSKSSQASASASGKSASGATASAKESSAKEKEGASK